MSLVNVGGAEEMSAAIAAVPLNPTTKPRMESRIKYLELLEKIRRGCEKWHALPRSKYINNPLQPA
jgi:hypothetical protein